MVRDGYFYGAGCVLAAAIVAWLAAWPYAIPLLLLAAFFVWFFRDPERQIPPDRGAVVSPGDGRVTDVSQVTLGGAMQTRISIFLSVFDVHVNRSPVSGTIAYARYQPGKFLDARHPDVSHENESNTLGIVAAPLVAPGLKLLVRQLSGLIARRIICTHGVGDQLARGELFGMIKFGSRTELWLPVGCPHRVLVAPGERVRCGETVLVELLDQPPLVGAGVPAAPAPSAAAAVQR